MQGQRADDHSSVQSVPAEPLKALALERLRPLAGASVNAPDRDLITTMLDKIVVHRDAIVLTIRDPAGPTSPAKAIRVAWRKPDSHRRRDMIMPFALDRPRFDDQWRALGLARPV